MIEDMPPVKGIFYLKQDLCRAVRKEAFFLGELRAVLAEELKRESELRLVPVSLLPYTEDAALVLEDGTSPGGKICGRIAERVCDLMRKEFLCTQMYRVSVRFLGCFGGVYPTMIDPFLIKHFRTREKTKVIVASWGELRHRMPAVFASAKEVFGDKLPKYVCVEYDAEKEEIVRSVASDSVADQIALHLQQGNGVAVYE